jgi:hypothetical protein
MEQTVVPLIIVVVCGGSLAYLAYHNGGPHKRHVERCVARTDPRLRYLLSFATFVATLSVTLNARHLLSSVLSSHQSHSSNA